MGLIRFGHQARGFWSTRLSGRSVEIPFAAEYPCRLDKQGAWVRRRRGRGTSEFRKKKETPMQANKKMADRKKLKEEYRNRIPEKGIFAIKNNRNGKVFLGSSLNLHGVLDKNRFILNIGSHKNEQLQKDWKNFGEEAFTFEILETLKIKDEAGYDYDEDLKILEMLWVDKYRPFEKNCYNKNEHIRTV